MKNTMQSIIGWVAGLAIGMTIGVSQNSIILGIGLIIIEPKHFSKKNNVG